jgi:hypothetical protein
MLATFSGTVGGQLTQVLLYNDTLTLFRGGKLFSDVPISLGGSWKPSPQNWWTAVDLLDRWTRTKFNVLKFSRLWPIVFLLRVGYKQYTVGKSWKHAGEYCIFQYAAKETNRDFGLSFNISENFVLSCEEISLTCRQIHLRKECEFNVRRDAWEAYIATWNPNTNLVFVVCVRKSTDNLALVGQTQDISYRSRYSYPAVRGSLVPKTHLYDTQNSVPTLQRTHYILFMETSQLMLIGWVMDICTAAYKHINLRCGWSAECQCF